MKKRTLLRRGNIRWILLIVGLIVFSNLSAQGSAPILLKGNIQDSKTQETLVGVSVIVKGTTVGTMTDIDGNFQLEVPANGTLVVSYMGYTTREIPIGKGDRLSIALEQNSELLGEVLVIGYGQVRKDDATGAVLSIKPDQLNKGLQVTAEDALVGKLAGVNVVPGTGAPGKEGTIRIRMGASLSASNDPLIVIDGIPVQNTSISAINPNDIASFTVLKDASATAIYGSRASNGVIIVTTKKGNADGNMRPQINYNSKFSISHVFQYVDVLGTEEFREVFKQYSGAPETFKLGDASTNWQKEIYRSSFGSDHNLSVTGATLNTPYRVSLGYTNQDGIIVENNYERLNVGVGISPKFFDKHLSFDINLKGSIENDHPISTGVIGGAIGFDPTRPVYMQNPNNIGLGYFIWMNQGVPIALAASNPVADLRLSDKLDRTKRAIGNVVANYKIHGFEELALNVNAGFDLKNLEKTELIPQNAPSTWTSNKLDGRGRDYFEERDNQNYLIDIYANYSKDFARNHHVDAMAGYGWQRFWDKSNSRTNDSDGNEISLPTHGENELYLLSFYGRLNYSFAQKYLLTATLRADASSRFSPDNRWGYFPSGAFAWRINQENFMKNNRTISDLRLRLSYGKTGQQDVGSYYLHLSTYTASYNDSRYQFGNEWITMYRPNGYDPNIKWESTGTYNIGMDYGFLNNRISGSIDAYQRYTTNLLNEISVPAGSNFANRIYTNIGNMESKGLEVALTGIPIKTDEWEWSISGNFTWNTASITKLNTIETATNYVKTGDAGGTGRYLQIHMVGETPNTFFLLRQAYDEDGRPLDGKYVAKDGSITSSEEDANKYITGKSSRAPYFYGLSTRLMYRNWDIGLNGHGSFGNYVFNYQRAGQSLASLYGTQGTSSNIMRSTLETGFTQERLYSDYFLESGAFFRLDNITLGHTFNKPVNFIQDLRVSFSVQNVFTITKYTGIDPEIYNGIDRNTYQRPRIFLVGLNLNF